MTCEIVGTVTTASGAPAAGAIVVLEDLSNRSGTESFGANRGAYATRDSMCDHLVLDLRNEPSRSDRSGARCLVDSDGGFRFTGIEPGARINLAALHCDEGTALVTDLFAEPVRPPQSVALVLVPGVIVHGTVRDERGEPVEGASIEVSHLATIETHDGPGRSGSENCSVRVGRYASDASGAFRTIPLAFPRIGVSVQAPGYFDGGAIAFDVPPGEHDHLLDFRLARSPTLRGRILGSGGGPADLARAIPPSDDHGHGGLEVFASVSDPFACDLDHLNGERGTLEFSRDRFEVVPHDSNPRERPKRFVSIWSRRVFLGATRIGEPSAELDVTIDLSKLPPPPAPPATRPDPASPAPPQGVVTLAVVDACDGAPIRSFEVAASAAGPGFVSYRETRQFQDRGGIARLDDLRFAPLHVLVWARGFAPYRTELPLRATTFADKAQAPVRIELSRAVARIVGRVENADGRPLEFADVKLLTPEGEPALPGDSGRFATDGAGRFVFDQVGVGDYVVVASAFGDGPASAFVSTTTAAAETVVRLARGVDVTVKPFRRGVLPDGPFEMRIRDDRGVPVFDPCRDFGVASWTGGGGNRVRLAPGRYTGEVFCAGFAIGRASFAATPNGVVDVEMVPLPEGASDR